MKPKLIFLYGPPAVGKLTIGEGLAQITGFRLVDNHSLANPIAHVFGWDHPERKRLTDVLRLELFDSAMRHGISVITTFGGGGDAEDRFIQKLQATVHAAGGEMVFVRLMAPQEVLFERVREASRLKYKKMITPEALQQQVEKAPDIFARAQVGPHLEIDTSLHSVDQSVEMIIRILQEGSISA